MPFAAAQLQLRLSAVASAYLFVLALTLASTLLLTLLDGCLHPSPLLLIVAAFSLLFNYHSTRATNGPSAAPGEATMSALPPRKVHTADMPLPREPV